MAALPLDAATSLQDLRLSRYLFLAGTVILAYDHLLSLSSEVTYIWIPGHKRKNAVLYLFVRYFALCGNMAMFSLFFGNFTPESTRSCDKVHLANEILMVAQELVVGYTLVLRVLALYLFDKRVVFTLIGATIIALAVAAWGIVTGGNPVGLNSVYNSPFGCQIAGSLAGLAFDILLIGFTLYRGYRRWRSELFYPGPLWQVLVRDGEGLIPLGHYLLLILTRTSIVTSDSFHLVINLNPQFADVRKSIMIFNSFMKRHSFPLAGPRQCIVTHRRVHPSDPFAAELLCSLFTW
ncbi:hypothetical protein B0H19DRAFT_1065919 [Mycena capillaripes]|nr:hypothetical protein B0H19DRAFT_1065919 [Mycena capillaripes]